MATTSLTPKDVVIASAYGRGHWLASHLNEQGWSVTLIDYTSVLGEPQAEDYDGPFGLLETDLVSGSQKTHWLTEMAPTKTIEASSGFSIWLKNGPLEGQGPLATFLAQENSLSLAVRNYLHMVSDLSDTRLKSERVQLTKLPFESTWLPRFMHQIHSNVLRPSLQAFESVHAAPFFARYYFREVTKSSHQASLKSLTTKNIQVIEGTKVNSVSRSGDDEVILQTTAGALQSRSFVWTLSSSETKRATPDLLKQFYSNVELVPEWTWQRFNVEFKELPTEVPCGFVILQDPYLPWTHTNVIAVRTKEQGWTCWLRLPFNKIKDENYLRAQSQELALVLNSRLYWTEAKVSYAGGSVLQWNTYLAQDKNRLKKQIAKNIFISGPEHWAGIDALSRFQAHRKVLHGLESIRGVWDTRQAKQEAKEAQRLAKQKEREERMNR